MWQSKRSVVCLGDEVRHGFALLKRSCWLGAQLAGWLAAKLSRPNRATSIQTTPLAAGVAMALFLQSAEVVPTQYSGVHPSRVSSERPHLATIWPGVGISLTQKTFSYTATNFSKRSRAFNRLQRAGSSDQSDCSRTQRLEQY